MNNFKGKWSVKTIEKNCQLKLEKLNNLQEELQKKGLKKTAK